MKTTEKQKLAMIGILSILHNALFWNENIGINSLLYSVLLIGTLYYLYPISFLRKSVLKTLVGVIVSLVLVILYGSSAAKFCHIIAMTIFVGFVQAPQLRSVIFAFKAVLESFGNIPKSLFSSKQDDENSDANQSNKNLRIIKLSAIPFIFLFIFYWIYKFANPVFDSITDKIWDTIIDSIASIFENFSFTRIIFCLIGFAIAATIIYKPIIQNALLKELNLSDILIRFKIRNDSNKPKRNFSFYGLKNEYISAIILVGLINILVLVVNIIDINWIWINFDSKAIKNLSQFVHEGTYLLIISILLSMGILEYFFRKNINFYSKNQVLKTLCYAWILQNIVMVISVALRNFHYIERHGLAYKRIGVVFFLILTLIGLISQIIKINTKGSGYYMLRINSWACYFTMIAIACFNWDIIIANHNINHNNPKNIDTDFLLELSPKTLPILAEHKEIFSSVRGYYVNYSNGTYEFMTQQQILDKNIKDFIRQYETRTWLSWNYTDYNAYNTLKSNK